ncbi:MAG: hypothetical protein ABL882_06500 [Sphingopyxis sp.]
MLRSLLFVILALLIAAPASAEVIVTFWSHDRDQNYQHAFLTMRGRIDASGEVVDTNIGFTAQTTSPLVLLGSVAGRMEVLSAPYVARATSRPHFALRMNDAQYARLSAFIAAWGAQRNGYNLNRRNCVHFVMEAAALFGLQVNRGSVFFRRPRDFLNEMMRLNPTLTPATR